MNLHDWIDELCDALDVEIDLDEALILDVAKDAADNVERSAAPITAFLLGYAAAHSNGNPDAVEKLASAASDLAVRWDKSPDVLDVEEPDLELDGDLGEDPGIDDELETAEA